MGHVLIAGCGYLGTALGVRLVADGHVVWGLRRRVAELPTSIRPVEADLSVPNTMRNLPRVDSVVFLASADPGAFRYLVGAVAASQRKVQRLLVASGLELYGDRGGAWVDEDSAVAPASERGRSLAEIEALAREAPWPTTVVRIGEVYGPSRLGILSQVLSGEPVPLHVPGAHANLIHRDDAVSALAHVLGRKKVERLYLAVDGTPVPRLELLEWLSARTGRPSPPVTSAPSGPSDVRAMSDRLIESGLRLRYPSFREGYEPLLLRLAR